MTRTYVPLKKGSYDLYSIRNNLVKNDLHCWTGSGFSGDAKSWAYYVDYESVEKTINSLCEQGILNFCVPMITDLSVEK